MTLKPIQISDFEREVLKATTEELARELFLSALKELLSDPASKKAIHELMRE